MLCVSQYDELLLQNLLQSGSTRLSRLINSIETNLFRPTDVKQRVIAYMPRKNAKDSSVVAAILQSKLWFRDYGWSSSGN